MVHLSVQATGPGLNLSGGNNKMTAHNPGLQKITGHSEKNVGPVGGPPACRPKQTLRPFGAYKYFRISSFSSNLVIGVPFILL